MQQGRRLILGVLGSGMAATLGAVLYPLIRFLVPPAAARGEVNEASGGKTGDLRPNAGKIVKFGSRPVLLVRIDESHWRAYSAVCTHLGCTVQYQERERRIWCACHGGTYDLNGRVISGPPPRPLDSYTVHVRGEEVIISRGA